MKEYREVLKFKYNKKSYRMYLDNQNKKYFLRDDNGQLSYLDRDEFIEIGHAFCDTPHILRAKRDGKEKGFIRVIPKILIGGVAVPLTLVTFIFGSAFVKEFAKEFAPDNYVPYKIVATDNKNEPTKNEGTTTQQQSDIQNKLSFVIEPSDEEFVVDTYLASEYSKYIYVYDNDHLDKILDYETVTEDQLHDVVDSNSRITPKYKDFVHKFISDFVEKHPNAERRILYENLKTLEFVECTERELMMASLSVDSYGCYIRTENKIYLLKDYEYKEGTWEYQVIYHELCHVARTGFWDGKGKQIRVQCEGLNFYTTTSAEALNSLFAVSLFDYEEKDIAYQLQSNYFQIMLEVMDNYTLDDYMNKPLSYFAQKLDEYNGDYNYAPMILEGMEAQFNDYHSNKIEIDQEEYFPIYDYVSDMHYEKFITPNMTYDEARAVADKMVERILFDVPEEYNIYTQRFYDNLDEYCRSIGIEVTTLSR